MFVDTKSLYTNIDHHDRWYMYVFFHVESFYAIDGATVELLTKENGSTTFIVAASSKIVFF